MCRSDPPLPPREVGLGLGMEVTFCIVQVEQSDSHPGVLQARIRVGRTLRLKAGCGIVERPGVAEGHPIRCYARQDLSLVGWRVAASITAAAFPPRFDAESGRAEAPNTTPIQVINSHATSCKTGQLASRPTLRFLWRDRRVESVQIHGLS